MNEKVACVKGNDMVGNCGIKPFTIAAKRII